MFGRQSAYVLAICVTFLLGIGIVMLFSVSAYAQDAHGDIYYFLRRQLIWLGLGAVACLIASVVDYSVWRRLAWPLLGVAVLLLILCFVPGIGARINGSWRWVKFGPVSFQPSEIAKLACVIALAHWFAKYEKEARRFGQGFLLPVILFAIPTLLILREEDMGTALLVGTVSVMIMFIGGANVIYMIALALVLGGGIYLKAANNTNRAGRMTAFLDLEKYKDSFGLQQWEALRAFNMGGTQGLGLGDSREKMRYLPYAHTDFIFPIIGEELGLRATLPIVGAFLLIALCGITIALRSRDRFGTLLAFGVVLMITLQAAVNIGVTTAVLPNKGMPLPFISAGGSNLCMALLFVGILLSIHRHGGGEVKASLPEALPAAARVRAKVGKRSPARRIAARTTDSQQK